MCGRRDLGLAPAATFALFVGVLVGHGGLEVAVALLLSDPGEEGLEFGGGAEAVQGVEALVETLVGVGGVELLVAGFAQGRAVLGLATLLFGSEMMLGDEGGGDLALAKVAAWPVVRMTHKSLWVRMLG